MPLFFISQNFVTKIQVNGGKMKSVTVKTTVELRIGI